MPTNRQIAFYYILPSLPREEETFFACVNNKNLQLSNKQYIFSSLDLLSAYTHAKMEESDILRVKHAEHENNFPPSVENCYYIHEIRTINQFL